ncbi:hypothetical protein [Jiella pelagia]|uniref:Uncharacterized protein n=1 Tax=Jiella pelagia TaxID=2986949 RepID=A0ABY7BZX4_9HYPH|nr:hypothetical protein [Jiella pelagia]WAP68185.1 hypothetical protein OH818_22880 [Jiella pelagia]
MGGSKFIPIVVALIVGLFIGWLIGPDVDDVSENVDEEIASLREPINQTQASVLSVSEAVSGKLDETSQAVTDAVAGLQTRMDQLGQTIETKTNEITAAVQPQQDQGEDQASQGIAELKTQIEQLQQSVSQISEGQQSGGQGGGDVAQLVQSIGATGAILVPGQSAVFGSGRVSVSEVADGSATLSTGSGEPQDVQAGSSVDLGSGCSVTLAGVASGAAFLSTEGCDGGSGQAAGASEGGEQQAASQGGQQSSGDSSGQDGAEQAAAAAAATSETSGQPAQDSPQTANQGGQQGQSGASGGSGGAVPVGGTASFGETRIFVSGVTDEGATLMVIGGQRQQVATGSSIDAGNGCSITLDSTENNAATLSASGCEGGQGEAQPAGQPDEQEGQPDQQASAEEGQGGGEQQAAAPSGEQAAGAAGGSASQPAAQSGSGETFGAGQTAVFGENRIFVSGVQDNAATLFVVGGAGRTSLDVGQSADIGNGCSVTLDAVNDGRVTISATGCDGGQAGQPDQGEQVDQSSQPQQSGESQAAAPEPAAQPAGVATPQASSAPTETASLGSDATSTGQTKAFGDHKVFVSAVSDQGATLYIVGTGRQVVATGDAVDLGDGCSVTVDQVGGGAALLTGSGC